MEFWNNNKQKNLDSINKANKLYQTKLESDNRIKEVKKANKKSKPDYAYKKYYA